MIAIFGDIHANHAALDAVLTHCRQLGVSRCYSVGDVVGYYAQPAQCIDMLVAHDIPAVAGNHDRYVVAGAEDEAIRESARVVVEWTRKTLPAEHVRFLGGLPLVRRIDGPIAFRLVHASLAQPYLWKYVTSLGDAVNALSMQDVPLCFCGHTHVVAGFELWDGVRGGAFREVYLHPEGRYLVNVGSVGQPRDGGYEARVVLFSPEERTLRVEHVPYDPAPTIAAHRAAGLPDELVQMFQ